MKTALKLFISFVLLIATSFTSAQPSLSPAQSQAPIDGGLGLQAASGGVYAWKKLISNSE